MLTSVYLSQHLAKHCCSLLLRDVDGLVTHLSKHLSRTVCGTQGQRSKPSTDKKMSRLMSRVPLAHRICYAAFVSRPVRYDPNTTGGIQEHPIMKHMKATYLLELNMRARRT